MEKLELKHVLPYLEHKVLLSYNDCLTGRRRTAYLTGVTLTEIETTYKRKIKGVSGDIIGWEGDNNVKDLNVKLILHPLSELVVNGEEVTVEYLQGCCYSYVQYLISQHFDVYDLIPKGLADNINTL